MEPGEDFEDLLREDWAAEKSREARFAAVNLFINDIQDPETKAALFALLHLIRNPL